MAYVLKNGVIELHIPRTGGFWRKKVVHELNLFSSNSKMDHSTLEEFQFLKHEIAAKKFVFIRHPLTWFQSFWAFQNDVNWLPISSNPFINLMEFNDLPFEKFVISVYARYPRYLTRLYAMYIDDSIIVKKYENLREDFAVLLTEVGLVFDRKILDETSIVNHSLTQKPVYSEKIKNLVLENEKEIIERYYG